ncbi:hypothetical protein B0H15DRAFT_821553 [Mycena belliarum]|uniref:Uncharacterized protein n=1 Tax=Mycena belliarum TaxID=1033014 RepID=A0AAD6UDQ2_9AGAR|nr:hypothetical protein B0H15DRAFT_821553 [Mycena belliae]
MRSFASLLAVSSFLTLVNAQALIINTPIPAPVSCEPTLLSWGGGTGPYFIVLVNGNDPTQNLVNFGELSNTSITWFVKEPAGTPLLLTIRDQTGATQSSAPFSVAAGGPTTCLNGGSSSSSPPGSSSSSAGSVSTSKTTATTATTAASTKSTTTSPPTSSTSAPSTSSGSRSAASSAASAASSSTRGGALPTSVPAAAALGAFGAVLAALL